MVINLLKKLEYLLNICYTGRNSRSVSKRLTYVGGIMESKNVKVIDEHNIDRDANIVCAFNVDSNDYVLYWIERDEENANLFVSKILKNNDGTYNMSNIEDASEKSKIGDVVKGMVTLAIKNENENEKASSKVSLEDGKEIDLSNVRFNKEQNINVAKTYVTTVKKTVAKVSNDFFDVPVKEEKTEEPLFNDIFVAPPVEEIKSEMPSIDNDTEGTNEVATEDTVSNEEVMNSFVENVNTEPVAITPVVEAPKEENSVAEPTPEPVTEKVEIPSPVATAAATIPVTSAVPQQPTETQSFFEEKPVKNEEKLVFDATNETNLNNALNNNNLENIVVTNDAESLRAFGVNEGATVNTETPAPAQVPEAAPAKTLTRTKGFANSIVVTVIGVILFVAACVFMGYEIFNYFHLAR